MICLQMFLEDADVVIQAYRYRSLEQKGIDLIFLNDVPEMANKIGEEMIYLDLTYYSPGGTHSEAPGYQQIVDAVNDASYVFGKAYGLGEGSWRAALATQY